MLTLALCLGLLFGASREAICQERCNSEMSRCASGCGTSQTCLNRCDPRRERCVEGCTAGAEKQKDAAREQKKNTLPCLGPKNVPRPCTETEERKLRETAKNAKAPGLCRDKEGNLRACPEAADKGMKLVEEYKAKHPCKDKDGMPIACPKK